MAAAADAASAAADAAARINALAPVRLGGGEQLWYTADGLPSERALVATVVARLLDCVSAEAAPFPPDTANLALAVCVAIRRHRFVVDPQDTHPEGTATLAARAAALKATFEETGIDKLFDRLLELKLHLWFDAGRPELPLRTSLALFGTWVLALYGWSAAVEGARYPDALNGWKIIPNSVPEAKQEWMLSTQLPDVAALMRNTEEHPIIRSMACWIPCIVWWGVPTSFQRKALPEYGLLDACCGLLEELCPAPPPNAGRDEVALASADELGVLSITSQMFVGLGSLFNLSSAVAKVPTLPREFAQACLKTGAPLFFARWLKAFMQLRPGEAAHSELSSSCMFLQFIAAPDTSCANQLLEALASVGMSAVEVHKVLLYAIAHGPEIKNVHISDSRLETKAANVMAHLFGREEAEGDDGSVPSITVPSSVIFELVAALHKMIDGTHAGNVTSQLDAMLWQSLSLTRTQLG
jgi:hypothetical protein